MATHVYNAGEGSCVVFGTVVKFQRVEVGKDNDKNIFTEGTTGEVVVSVQSDKLGFIRVVTQKATTQNLQLAAYAEANVFGEVIFKSGNALFLIPVAALMKDPDATYETEDGELIWEYKGEFASYLPNGV